jgi:PBP1b-binding outer membrane lipoprotein LpoB
MRMPVFAFAALAALAVAGCSHPAPTTAATPASAASTTRVATPWDGDLKALARAKSVQNVIDRQAAQQRQQIDAESH